MTDIEYKNELEKFKVDEITIQSGQRKTGSYVHFCWADIVWKEQRQYIEEDSLEELRVRVLAYLEHINAYKEINENN